MLTKPKSLIGCIQFVDILNKIFGSEATIDGHLTLNQNIRVEAVSTTSTNFEWRMKDSIGQSL
jgi:hypothetical protein